MTKQSHCIFSSFATNPVQPQSIEFVQIKVTIFVLKSYTSQFLQRFTNIIDFKYGAICFVLLNCVSWSYTWGNNSIAIKHTNNPAIELKVEPLEEDKTDL